MSLPQAYFIDLFAGAGGTSTGIEHSRCFDKKVAKVIACVNHDENAIASHKENHPDCLHLTEDIRTVNLTPLITLVRHIRKINPSAKIYLWASLECTEYSIAKGGLARDADSRTLANDLFRYTDAIDFDGVFIENVKEFMTGGPMRIKPKKLQPNPLMYTELTLIKDKKTKKLKYGWEPIPERKGEYYKKWVEKMKSSYDYHFDHRILDAADFGAYTSRKRYFGIFAKKHIPIAFPSQTHSKKEKNGLRKWKAVKDVLDFNNTGESIFNRKKPLAERTLQRIYAGMIKYVAEGDTSFLAYYYGQHTLSSVDSPCNTLRTKDTGSFLNIVPMWWIDRQFGQGGGKNSSIEEPIGSLPTVPKASLTSVWISSPHYKNKGSSVEDPMPVITANGKQHCLMFPQWGIKYATKSIENPSPTLIARMDKCMPSFIQFDTTNIPIAIEIYDSDSETMIKIKKFMAAYGIVDIKMRALEIMELMKITGFPDDYVLKGTKTEKKRYIGNAVPVLLAKAIIEGFMENLQNPLKKAA